MALTDAHRRALDAITAVLATPTYLAGGTAVALRLNHRVSRDLDLFTREDPESFTEALSQLDGVTISGRGKGALYLDVLGVPVSVIRYRYPMLQETCDLDILPLKVANTRDLICMKLSALTARGAKRDFWDVHSLIVSDNLDLELVLGWFKEKYRREDIGHVVRSLVYFADADAEPPLERLSAQHWQQIKSDLRRWVKSLGPA